MISDELAAIDSGGTQSDFASLQESHGTAHRAAGRPTYLWINEPEGYGWEARQLKRHRHWCGIPILPKIEWEFSVILKHPVTFQSPTGYWRTKRQVFRMDMGSVPPPFNLFIPVNLYPCSFAFHDEVWGAGGLMWSARMTGPWEFAPMSRTEGNRWLWHWVNAEGVSRLTPIASGVIQGGVAIGAAYRALREKLDASRG